jgi:hypothetical protein
MREARVCPDCGAPAGAEAFCSDCGRNLSGIDRLPTHEEWKQQTVAKGHAEAQRIAAALATIGTLTPFRYDEDAAETVQAAVRNAVTKAMPREDRENPLAVTVTGSGHAAEGVSAVAAITLSDGAELRQRFDASANDGNARINVIRAGPPQLVATGLSGPVAVTTDVPATARGVNADEPQPSLSSADARRETKTVPPPSDRNSVGQGTIVFYGVGLVCVVVGIHLATITRINLLTGQTSSPDLGVGIVLIVVGLLVVVIAQRTAKRNLRE